MPERPTGKPELPRYKSDILIANHALLGLKRKLYKDETGLAVEMGFDQMVSDTLGELQDLLPENFLFWVDRVGPAEKGDNEFHKMLKGKGGVAKRLYCLPKARDIITIDNSPWLGGLGDGADPDQPDFVGFDQLRRNNYYCLRYGVYTERVDPRKVKLALYGADDEDNFRASIISPFKTKYLLKAVRDILTKRNGLEETNQLLQIADRFMEVHAERLLALYEKSLPAIKLRLLNFAVALRGSGYGLMLPFIAPVKQYSHDEEKENFYYTVDEAKLVKSLQAPKRALWGLGGIQSVPGAIDATIWEFYDRLDRMEYILTDVLPSGWGLWGSEWEK